MSTSMSRAGRSARYYTITQAAWLLGTDPARVSRAVRVGELRAVRRRARLVIPEHEVTRVLSGGDR